MLPSPGPDTPDDQRFAHDLQVARFGHSPRRRASGQAHAFGGSRRRRTARKVSCRDAGGQLDRGADCHGRCRSLHRNRKMRCSSRERPFGPRDHVPLNDDQVPAIPPVPRSVAAAAVRPSLSLLVTHSQPVYPPGSSGGCWSPTRAWPRPRRSGPPVHEVGA